MTIPWLRDGSRSVVASCLLQNEKSKTRRASEIRREYIAKAVYIIMGRAQKTGQQHDFDGFVNSATLDDSIVWHIVGVSVCRLRKESLARACCSKLCVSTLESSLTIGWTNHWPQYPCRLNISFHWQEPQ